MMIGGSLAVAGAAFPATPRWNHTSVKSATASAAIDFQVSRLSLASRDGAVSGYQNSASPLWINVSRAGLSATDTVHAMLINHIRECIGATCSDFIENSSFDLKYAEPGRFTALAHPVLFNSLRRDNFGTSTRQTHQELVFWIDGQINKDRAGHNLGFNLQAAVR